MSAGNFYTRRNASDTTVIPSAGTNVDASWDTLVKDDGSIVSYSSPNLQVDTGLYLVMYSERFETTPKTADSTNRIEIQGEILSGGSPIGGYGQDYIRNDSDQYECIVSGYAFVQVTSDNTNLAIRFYRTDNSTKTVNRVPGYGGVTILEMDDSSHNFGFASASASEATSGTTERTLALNTSDKMDTGFSLASNQITVSSAGRYVVTYCMDISQTGTGRENVRAWLRKNGTTNITGSQAHCYMRGSDGTQDGALTWIGIVDASASDAFDVRWDCPTSATITCAAGTGKLQMWQLPSAADVCLVEATTGNFNALGEFDWDTNPHIDTDSFTHTTGTSNIDVDQDDHCLVFATFSKLTDSVARAYPMAQIQAGGTIRNYAAGGEYDRNSSTYGSALTVAGLINEVAADQSLEIYITPEATGGTLTNAVGQFAVLSLDSIWSYTYDFPATVTDFNTTESFLWTSKDLVITGFAFEASQGSGKVEMWSDVTGTTKVSQSVDSWSDTSIQIDAVQGTLNDDTTVYLVVTPNTNAPSTPLALTVGVKGYVDTVKDLSPNFYWTFQNTWLTTDSSDAANNSSGGTPGFGTTPLLVRGDTHSLEIAGTDYISPSDITGMNLVAQDRRYMGGWIQVDSISQILAVLYEEGAQVNNIAFLLGFGNSLMLQVADTGDDYVQCYSNIKLTPNRPYHIWFKFHASGYDGEVLLFLDGIEQDRTNGNPWTASDLDAHSGNISWGHEGTENLQVGDSTGADNVDIAFASPDSCFYSHWASWHGVAFDTDNVRTELFEKGALAGVTISGGTEAAMQTALDAYADTVRPDWPCAIKIADCTAGDFALTFDNITFSPRCSIDVMYTGGSTLTITTENGSSIDSNKIATPYGGTVVVQNAPPVTIHVVDASTLADVVGARVLLEKVSDGTDIISGVTDSNGEITVNYVYSTNVPVTGRVRKSTSTPLYSQASIAGTITASGLFLTAYMVRDE